MMLQEFLHIGTYLIKVSNFPGRSLFDNFKNVENDFFKTVP